MPLIPGSGQLFHAFSDHAERRRGRPCLSRFISRMTSLSVSVGVNELAHGIVRSFDATTRV
jgi:hypothetical protein